jgi:hypothetical protein
MKMNIRRLGAALLLAAAGALPAAAQAQQTEAQTVGELRNTVINLLQGLVERGVLTREQAAQMVRDAQTKAQADAAALATAEKADEGAVRVPYVPEIVKDQIRDQVKEELRAEVAREVVQTAQSEGWGVPAALPEWIRGMRWSGDLRLRGQGDLFASDNLPNTYLDFQRINAAGGIGRAGISAFTNTSEDRYRMRARLRFGFESDLGSGWSMGARLATGALTDPVSTNTTLGIGGDRHQLGLDLAWLRLDIGKDASPQAFMVSGGRLHNPFFNASTLVYDEDLAFDGVAARYRLGVDEAAFSRNVYLTAGWFPLQEVELSSQDKWMLGGQLGMQWTFGSAVRLQAAASYYDYRHVAGRRNSLDSTLLDYTAPQHLRQGNTLFDIRNDTDPSTNLFALAADYQLVNYGMKLDLGIGAGYKATLAGDYVQNIGYDAAQVLARRGLAVTRRNTGYQAELTFGSKAMNRANTWRALVGYRYLQRDAVLDAYTESDFRLGGTDTKGYYLGLDYAFAPKVRGSLKYSSANEIDGPALGIDVLQFDVIASF